MLYVNWCLCDYIAVILPVIAFSADLHSSVVFDKNIFQLLNTADMYIGCLLIFPAIHLVPLAIKHYNLCGVFVFVHVTRLVDYFVL